MLGKDFMNKDFKKVGIQKEKPTPVFTKISTEHIRDWIPEDLSKIDDKYPLITKGNATCASAHIKWDPSRSELLYSVIEPEIQEEMKLVLSRIESELIDRLEIDFEAFKKKKFQTFLTDETAKITKALGVSFTKEQQDTLAYYIERDFVGLSQIEPLFRDPNLEDISCDGIKIPVFVFHRNPIYGSIRTNVMFNKKEELDSFVMKLAQRCGRSISVAEPLLDGTLPDGSRVQETYGSDISRRGSTFTIRKFMKDPLTPVDMLKYGTLDDRMLAYLWFAVEHGQSILVAGASATGKTALLNVLSLFMDPDAKIVSIEDTAELQLPHENWLPQVARAGFGGEKKFGEVSMFDLLKASMRQRPDYIVVGEVRGKEANVLFQEMASGHPGMSTMHADSIDAVMDRLETAPISLPPSLIEQLDILVVLVREKVKGRYVRRVRDIVEITGFDMKNNRPLVNKVFSWKQSADVFTYSGKSRILSEIMNETGTGVESLQEELDRRAQILRWMFRKGILYYKDVHKYIDMYYKAPSKLVKKVSEG